MWRYTQATLAAVVLLLPLVSGCGGLFFQVKVDSLRDPSAESLPRYVLLPGNSGIQVTDLQFREFAAYVRRALDARGFQAVEELDKADVAIFLAYGIGNPQTVSYSFPIYGQTGGGVSTFSASSFGTGRYSTTTGTISSPPTYGQVGNIPVTETTYLRYIVLDAVDVGFFARSNSIRQVWKTTISSSGSSADLRRVFPVMIGAATEHLGTDTRGQVRFTLTEGDSRVLRVKGKK